MGAGTQTQDLTGEAKVPPTEPSLQPHMQHVFMCPLKNKVSRAVVEHGFNPSTHVSEQPGLHSETLF